jgi:hypothetical protein
MLAFLKSPGPHVSSEMGDEVRLDANRLTRALDLKEFKVECLSGPKRERLENLMQEPAFLAQQTLPGISTLTA